MASSAARRLSVEPPTGVTGAFTGLVLQDTYTLGRRIGYGAVGEVYEAAHVRLPERVAVKMLRPHLVGNEAAFARFCREAEMMSAIHNPHVVQVLDFNKTPEGLPFFVMEYLDGVDLEVRLAYAGPLSLAAAVRIVDGVASALSAAHAHGIVHRDLKPANIFLVRQELVRDGPDADFVKVIDFGISKPVASGPRLSKLSDVVGTPEYMAPEQAQGLVDKIDGRTDQFALAGVAHTMLTGHTPFSGRDYTSLLHNVVHEPHARLSQWISWDTSAIQAVLDRALAKSQEERFDEIVEFAQAFAAAAAVAMTGVATGGVATTGLGTDVPPQIDEEEASYDPPPVRTFVDVEDATPKVELLEGRPAVGRDVSVPFNVPDLPPGIDRVPRMRQRAIAVAVIVLGLAGVLVYKGWRRAGTAASRPVPAAVEPRPAAAPEIVPVEPAAAAAKASPSPPPREPATPRASARRARGAESRADEPRNDLEPALPSPASESEPLRPAPIRDVPAPESPAPKGFSIPEPTPLPSGRDLAPPPAPSE